MMRAAPIVLAGGAGAHLDELLASRFLPQHWARRIRRAQDLPARLQHRVARLAPDSEWRAYSDGVRIFFAIARLHAPDVARASGMALDVYFLDRDGVVYSAAVWVNDSKQGWWLDAVLDASYDCEQGWWFEALFDAQPPAMAELTPLPVLSNVVARLSAPAASGRKSRP